MSVTSTPRVRKTMSQIDFSQIMQITQRGRSDISEIEAAIATAIASRSGDNPVRTMLQAIVCSAARR
jgi:hypothetical protein